MPHLDLDPGRPIERFLDRSFGDRENPFCLLALAAVAVAYAPVWIVAAMFRRAEPEE